MGLFESREYLCASGVDVELGINGRDTWHIKSNNRSIQIDSAVLEARGHGTAPE